MHESAMLHTWIMSRTLPGRYSRSCLSAYYYSQWSFHNSSLSMESDQVLYFDPPDRLLLEDFLPRTHQPVAATSPDLDGQSFDPEQAGQRGSRNALRASRPGLPLPHLTLTYAMSLDCKISLARGAQTALSGSRTRAMTHYLRSRHDAILIGVGTAEADDPSLNCRFSADGVNKLDLEKQPILVILDPNGR